MEPTKLLGPVYAEQVNSTFHLTTEDSQDFDLELIEIIVSETPSYQEQFSLIFRAPLNMPPEQKMYRLEHDRMGPAEILLVPVSRDQQGLYFEAVFNRLVE